MTARDPAVHAAEKAAIAKIDHPVPETNPASMTRAELATYIDELVQKKVAIVAEHTGMRLPANWQAEVRAAASLPTIEEAQAVAHERFLRGQFIDGIPTVEGWYVHEKAGVPVHMWTGGGGR